MSTIIRNYLGKRGIQLTRLFSVDWRNRDFHPLDILYRTTDLLTPTYVLLHIPISKCRTQLWHTLENDKNPFVQTIIEYKEEVALNYDLSKMKIYYENYRPQNAAEVIRLPGNQFMRRIPAYAYTLPWDSNSIEEIFKDREKDSRKENSRAGKGIGINAGHTDFGPVEQKKGEIEFNRLIGVYKSIEEKGYREKYFLGDGGIKGYFLVGEKEEWCFVIQSGKHRAYALAALGNTKIPVILNFNLKAIKQVSHVDYWSKVKEGFFSKEEALSVAFRIVNLRDING
ncbi:MAG: hypothetical protein H3C64_04115 [Candidatus Kuenenia stuttgartiensis]|nr:hypothetical protein [Candidatus Kuenenia stuttgartiensis]